MHFEHLLYIDVKFILVPTHLQATYQEMFKYVITGSFCADIKHNVSLDAPQSRSKPLYNN